MSSCHRSCPPGPPTGTVDTVCRRVRRIFMPCPLLRATPPANDNPSPAAPTVNRRLAWIGLATLLAGFAAAAALA